MQAYMAPLTRASMGSGERGKEGHISISPQKEARKKGHTSDTEIGHDEEGKDGRRGG